MKNEFLKTLWLLRFQKIKKTEEEAAWQYQEILDQCLVEFGKEGQIVDYLRQLVHDERMHEKLADEMTQIAYQNHPECGTLSL